MTSDSPPPAAKGLLPAWPQVTTHTAVRWGAYAIVGTFAGLVVFTDALKGLDVVWLVLMVAATYCLLTLAEIAAGLQWLPAKQQLLLYAGAVLTACAASWVTDRLETRTYGIVFIVTLEAYRALTRFVVKRHDAAAQTKVAPTGGP